MSFRYRLARIGGLISGLIIPITGFCHWSSNRFYLGLAGFFSLAILLSPILGLSVGGIEQTTFDYALKIRLSSPQPAEDIVILDIDEKSLAELAPIYGRWPWKREVLAQVIAELEATEAQSIIFNILITDPDLGNEQSDALLNEISAESQIVAFPMVRLPEKNDGESDLKINQIPGVTIFEDNQQTVAAILPGFTGMQRNMGVANLTPDEDGIVRQYGLKWSEDNWAMPTIVGQAVNLSGKKSHVVEDSPYLLNWRNKKGDYKRISIVDYLATLNGEERISIDYFQGKHVIIGASAPGISMLVPTPVNPIADDNIVLATALDDAINGTFLRPIPPVYSTLLSVAFIVILAVMFVAGHSRRELDGVFAVIEIGSIALMFISLSYFYYYIDMTALATYGFAYYVIAKMHQNLSDRVIMGAPEQMVSATDNETRWIGIFAFHNESQNFKKLKQKFHELEQTFGFRRVFFCLDAFGGDQLLGSLNDIGCYVVVSDEKNHSKLSVNLCKKFKDINFIDYKCGIFAIPENAKNDEELMSKFISQKTLYVISDLEFG